MGWQGTKRIEMRGKGNNNTVKQKTDINHYRQITEHNIDANYYSLFNRDIKEMVTSV